VLGHRALDKRLQLCLWAEVQALHACKIDR